MKVDLNIKIDIPTSNFKDNIKRQELEEILLKVMLIDINDTVKSYTDQYVINSKISSNIQI